jgi:light-independent protochlorophyllide reductase subunit B
MGFEGSNVLFDTFIHPLVMGLEEHLLGMFREDFEFNDDARPSHHGHGPRIEAGPAAPEQPAQQPAAAAAPETAAEPAAADAGVVAAAPEAPAWTAEAEKELKKIPFFVRGKVRRNTERFAGERGLTTITVETMYDAKAHFSA